MRILLLTATYPPRIGGVEAVVRSLAVGFARKGHEVRVVVNRYPRSLPAEERLDGVEVSRLLFLRPSWEQLRRRRPDLWLASLFYAPATSLRLRRIVREFAPQVVNVHFPDAQVPFVLGLRRRFSFRLVLSLHGDDLLRWTRGRTGRAPGLPSGASLRRALLEADAVTACSRSLLDTATSLEPAVRAKGYVTPNGIDPSPFGSGRRYSHPRPYALAYGRFTPEKGFDLLLEAFHRAGGASGRLDLILAGLGPEEGRLRALRGALGLEERVLFYGAASAREVADLLGGCEFVVIPSREEAFGLVALEAMAAGKPFIATAVGGLGELAAQGGGEMVEPSAAALAESLARWLRNPPSPGRPRVPPGYRVEDMVERYLEVLTGGPEKPARR